jgi:hypothetical protein
VLECFARDLADSLALALGARGIVTIAYARPYARLDPV